VLLNRMVRAGFTLEQPLVQTAANAPRLAARIATIGAAPFRRLCGTTWRGSVLEPDWNTIRANLP
jgi:hypothetical protein